MLSINRTKKEINFVYPKNKNENKINCESIEKTEI